MDAPDAIRSGANAEGRRVRPVRDEQELRALEEAGRALPYVRFARDALGRWEVSGHGHAGHENEPRMPFVVDWLRRRVVPLLDPEADVGGAYRLELHDSYSYLPGPRGRHANSLSFGRAFGSRDAVALLPDPFQMGDYGGMLDAAAADGVPWDAKRPELFFAGSTTGARDPSTNARIAACLWSLSHRNVARFHLTNVVQMPAAEVLERAPLVRAVLHPPIPVEAHHQYRYQVNIEGNSACWSRVPMVLASGSLLLHLRPQRDELWYYPYLADGTHFVGADGLDDLLKQRARCEADPAWCRHLVANANRFVRDYLTSDRAAAYTAQLLEASAAAGAP